MRAKIFYSNHKRYNRIRFTPLIFDNWAEARPLCRLIILNHAQVEKDSFNLAEDTWINLKLCWFWGQVHLTYKKLMNKLIDFNSLSGRCFSAYMPSIKKMAYGSREGILVTIAEGYVARVVAIIRGVRCPTLFPVFCYRLYTQHFFWGEHFISILNDKMIPLLQ